MMKATVAVLVTGASSGIGRAITERLAADGHCVYAGARSEHDLRALDQMENVRSIRLDVTNPGDIAAAVATIRNNGGLYGLVNNAGVLTLGPVMESSGEEFDLVMAVNVIGPFSITRAFAPMIVAERGRIVTISSVAGVAAAGDASAYSMSKHAIEAFTDSLASEMDTLGVKVSVIEPGSFRTRISNNAAVRIGPHPRLSEFSKFKGPDEVAAAAELALFEPEPKRRYLVVPDESEARFTIRAQMAKLAQLNEGHAYTYDRSVLIQMLDEFLSQSRPRTV